MEYIFLVVYTLISLLIGFFIALLWLKKSKDRRSFKWISGLFYLSFSILSSSLLLMSISEILDKIVFKVTSYTFDINSFIKGFFELIIVFGLASGITTIIIFLFGYFISR